MYTAAKLLDLANKFERKVLRSKYAKVMTRDELHDHRINHDKTNSWWMTDAQGIPLCRVCDECETAARNTSGLLGDYGNYFSGDDDDDDIHKYDKEGWI